METQKTSVVTLDGETFSFRQHQTPVAENRWQVGVGLSKIRLINSFLPQYVPGLCRPSFGIVREGSDAYVVDEFGEKIQGDLAMRKAQGIPEVEALLRNFTSRSRLQIRAWSGAGNVIQNLTCTAWTAVDNALYASDLEGERLLVPYSGFGVTVDGTTKLGAFRYIPAAGHWRVSYMDEPNTGAFHLVITGQILLSRGVVQNPYASLEQANRFADKRHLILNGYTGLRDAKSGARIANPNGDLLKRDFGLDVLLNDPERLRKAITGKPVELNLSLTDIDGTVYGVNPDDLKEALLEKGYAACGTKREVAANRGLFHIDRVRNVIQLTYLKSPYPHHFVAVRPQEPNILYDGVIKGFSNNAGTNPRMLAEDLLQNGFSDAILLDNGGDAVLVDRTWSGCSGSLDPHGPNAVVSSCLARKHWAGIIAYPEATSGKVQIQTAFSEGR